MKVHDGIVTAFIFIHHLRGQWVMQGYTISYNSLLSLTVVQLSESHHTDWLSPGNQRDQDVIKESRNV